MRCFQICGYTSSGKTTVTTNIIRRLRSKKVQVASLKDICHESFKIDTEGKNTDLHRKAGADPVIARGLTETDFLYGTQMNLPEIARSISADWFVVEGYNSFPLPKIICGKTVEELDEFYDERTFAISGVISNELKEYRGQRIYNPLDQQDMDDLMEKIESTVFSLLPYVDDDCCRRCGLTCSRMVDAIVKGEKNRSDCQLDSAPVTLKVNGNEIPMVPFVQNILKNVVVTVPLKRFPGMMHINS